MNRTQTTIPNSLASEMGQAKVLDEGAVLGQRANSAKPTALKVSNALERLLPFPEHPDLDHLRTLVRIALDEALSIAYRSEPTDQDLEYIRFLEREARIFSAPTVPSGKA